MMIKIKYSFLQVDNYQGAMGKIIEKEIYLDINDSDSVFTAQNKAIQAIEDDKMDYKKENICINTIELIGFKTFNLY